MQDCSNSIALAMELLQSCTKPLSISYHAYKSREVFDISDTETHSLMIKNFYTATYLPFIITIVTNVQAKKSVCPENDSTENEIRPDETDDRKFFFFRTCWRNPRWSSTEQWYYFLLTYWSLKKIHVCKLCSWNESAQTNFKNIICINVCFLQFVQNISLVYAQRCDWPYQRLFDLG